VLGAKVVELSLYALGVIVAALFPVQLQCLLPHLAGLLVLSEGGVRMAEVVEGVRGLVGVAEGAAQGEGLVVVVEGLLVVAGAVGDEPEAVQGGRFTVDGVVVPEQGEGGVEWSRAVPRSPRRAANQPTVLSATASDAGWSRVR